MDWQWSFQVYDTLNTDRYLIVNLIVDIGNSFIKLAIFHADKEVYFKRYKKVLVRDLKALRKKYPFEKVISSSVRKTDPTFLRHLSSNYKYVVLSHKTQLPIKNNYKTPKTLGKDRLAVAGGAALLHKGKSALIIDIGTCVTYDFVDNKGQYWGGNISPGVELRLRAMHEFTSALPLVPRKGHKDILGKTTKEAIQNGAVWGLKLEIEGFIKTLTKERGKMLVILTGGDASYFGELLDSKIFVAPNFLLKSLNEILKYNS